MLDMRDFSRHKQVSIRSDPAVKKILDRGEFHMRQGALLYGGKPLNQTTLVNAAFVMLGEMDPAQLEEIIRPYVARLEAIMRDDEQDALRPQPAGDKLPSSGVVQSVDLGADRKRRAAQ